MYNFKVLIMLLISVILTGCSLGRPDNSQSMLKDPSAFNAISKTNTFSPPKNKTEDFFNDFNQDNEEKIIISTNNFGRSNPFKPYLERSLSFPIQNIPKPPYYTDENTAKLLNIRVNGILYDKKRPSAILSYENNDYVVHRGDMLFDFFISDIRVDKVVIQYKNNFHSAGIGEIIDQNTEKKENIENTNQNDLNNLPQITIPRP